MHGVGWLAMTKVANLLTQMGTKLILSWILVPHDFGLIGIAMIVITLVQNLSETGFSVALVQKNENITRPYFDAAWTIQLVRGVGIFVIIYFFAPLLVSFFETAESSNSNIVTVIRVLAFASCVESFSNVGIIQYNRDINFRKLTVYELSATMINAIVSITLVLIVRNVWALVFGILSGSFTRVIVSYLIHSHRPKISFNIKHIRELFNYGKWVFIYTLIDFLGIKVSDIFVAKMLGITSLGFYQMAFFIAMLPRNQLAEIVTMITFPLFSRLQNNEARLKKTFLISLELILATFMPVGIGLTLVGDLVVKICFAEKWYPIIGTLQILAFAGVIQSIIRNVEQLFKAINRPDVMLYQGLLAAMLTFVFLFPFTRMFGMEGVAMTIVCVAVFHLLLVFMFAKKMLQISLTDLLGAAIFSLTACAGMVIAILLLRVSVSVADSLSLVLNIIVGSFVYVGVLALFWKIGKVGAIHQLLAIKSVYNSGR